MSLPSERLSDLGLSLPPVVPPAAAYLSAVRFGDLVYTAGQVPIADGTLRAAGKVGAEVSIEDAVELCPDSSAQCAGGCCGPHWRC